jgi:hypothetical protein
MGIITYNLTHDEPRGGKRVLEALRRQHENKSFGKPRHTPPRDIAKETTAPTMPSHEVEDLIDKRFK